MKRTILFFFLIIASCACSAPSSPAEPTYPGEGDIFTADTLYQALHPLYVWAAAEDDNIAAALTTLATTTAGAQSALQASSSAQIASYVLIFNSNLASMSNQISSMSFDISTFTYNTNLTLLNMMNDLSAALASGTASNTAAIASLSLQIYNDEGSWIALHAGLVGAVNAAVATLTGMIGSLSYSTTDRFNANDGAFLFYKTGASFTYYNMDLRAASDEAELARTNGRILTLNGSCSSAIHDVVSSLNWATRNIPTIENDISNLQSSASMLLSLAGTSSTASTALALSQSVASAVLSLTGTSSTASTALALSQSIASAVFTPDMYNTFSTTYNFGAIISSASYVPISTMTFTPPYSGLYLIVGNADFSSVADTGISSGTAIESFCKFKMQYTWAGNNITPKAITIRHSWIGNSAQFIEMPIQLDAYVLLTGGTTYTFATWARDYSTNAHSTIPTSLSNSSTFSDPVYIHNSVNQ